ncbi:hypothetical protein Agub_g5468 [Astrephomene gubernaculifera]|uniref:Tryptophan synthase beta chain-like PALP domain-containing protein n=1 Tax=Astrephomene gubernaculifera TaxID=47775 RepID=A0AAD3DMD5_9CHLO|nr:hypothetical protein Agub_g5468 [Astrephomene gubernaculifera]
MSTPTTTELLLEALDREGWSTAEFRQPLADLSTSAPSTHDPTPPTVPSTSSSGAAGSIPYEAALAYGRIRRFVRYTPLDPCPWLSDLAGGGCRVWLKMESEQLSGSFKIRGALNTLLSLPPEVLSRGVFTASTGNHALAVLHACAVLSSSLTSSSSSSSSLPHASSVLPSLSACSHAPMRPVLYVPETASPYKIQKLRALGGQLQLYGRDCLETETAARSAAAAAGAVYVSPYNDPWVMAGQGTAALEILSDLPRGQLDVVFIPVGGGGLIGGMAAVLKAAHPNIRIVGCQPAASDVMARSVAAGRIVPEVKIPTLTETVSNSASTADANSTTVSGRYATGTMESGGTTPAVAAANAVAAAAPSSTLSDATAGGVEEGSLTLPPCMCCVDEWVAVGEEEIAEALVELLEQQAKMVEGCNDQHLPPPPSRP